MQVNELPRRKQRGIKAGVQKSFRGKPRGIGPEEIKRALLSVTDKTGILEFARGLSACGVEILSTGGTAALLRENDIPVREVSDYTGFPEMMDGRLKTLHPKIHGGLLAIRSQASHTERNIQAKGASVAHERRSEGLARCLLIEAFPYFLEFSLLETRDLIHLRLNLYHMNIAKSLLTNRTFALHYGGMTFSEERDRVPYCRCLSPPESTVVRLLPLRGGLF